MFILNREQLRDAAIGVIGGIALYACAVFFRGTIESYIGETLTSWLIPIVLVLFVILPILNLWDGWLSLRRWEQEDRERAAEKERQQKEQDREEQEHAAEWKVFENWVRQNPKTAERLMCIAESEQIDDPEYLAWLQEWREREGPNVLTDLPRLFDWMKSRNDLKKIGLNPDYPISD